MRVKPIKQSTPVRDRRRRKGIRDLYLAINRAGEKLKKARAKYQPPNHCCPSCACPGYDRACEAQERRIGWLFVLLIKDGQRDLAYAAVAEFEYGDGTICIPDRYSYVQLLADYMKSLVVSMCRDGS